MPDRTTIVLAPQEPEDFEIIRRDPDGMVLVQDKRTGSCFWEYPEEVPVPEAEGE